MVLPGKAAGSIFALIPGLVFAAALTLSLLAWSRAWRAEQGHAQQLFVRECDAVSAGLTAAVTAAESRLLMAWRLGLPAGGRTMSERPWQRLGPAFQDISYTAAAAGGAMPDGADPAWQAAAHQSAALGKPVLSGQLVGRLDRPPTFALVLADAEPAADTQTDTQTDKETSARPAVRGWLGVSLTLPALVEAAQERLPLPLAVAVREQGAWLTAGTEAAVGRGGDDAAFTREIPLTLGARPWQVQCRSSAAFDDGTRTGQQKVVLVVGVGLSFALWLSVNVLQSNQRRFKDIAESASDWFWETNSKFEFTYISDRFFEITGMDRLDVLGRTQWDVAGPRQIAAARKIWQAHFRVMAARESFRGLEMTLRDRNDGVRHILLSGKPSFYDNGIFRGYRGIGSDITERKAAEAEAARKSAQLRAAIEAMPNGLILFGEDLRLILYNRRFLELWGLTEEELEARRYMPHMIRFLAEQGRYGPGEVSQLVAERLAWIVQPAVQAYELKQGDGRIVEVRCYGRSAIGYLLTYLDITDQRATQAELMRSEKMAALGRLVAGVAHEINTPVGLGVSVASFLDLRTQRLLQHYQAGEVTQEDFEEYLEVARESCASLLSNLRRAAGLVRSFKLVAVDQSSERERSFNVKDYIEEVLLSLGPRFKKTHHKVSVDCSSDLMVTSDPGALSQILTNLVENSLIHGFEGRDEGQIQVSVANEGETLVLVYRDDGKGMQADQLEKMFEPFFTTRLGQGGSGLGMHVVYNLVTQRLGGQIRCDSAPGRGVIITIRHPITLPAPPGEEAEA